ncbi:hypothetical protein ACIBQX_11790 [Nonomuraea sp. NPDC049714]|uniref:hypothetical protein n=1 Tax=Nonomuraea sp. NPDC049714 TaxID=3364357 RepID=UPI0037AF567C
MTTINEAETGTTPETTPKSVAEALEYAHAYGQVAAFLATNPDLAKRAHYYHGTGFLACVNSAVDPAGTITDAARAGREAGARVEEEANGRHGGVKLNFGPIRLKVYADADKVCSRVVVGVVEDVQYALTVDLDGTPRKQAEAAK